MLLRPAGAVLRAVAASFAGLLSIAAAGCPSSTPAPRQGGEGAASRPPDLSRVQRTCDEADGICRVTLLPDLELSTRGRPSLIAILQFSAKDRNMAVAHLGFQVSSPSMHLKGCPVPAVVIDGAPLPPRPGQHHAALEPNRVVEALTILLDIPELRRASRARGVMVRLCGEELTLQEGDKVLLRRLLQAWGG